MDTSSDTCRRRAERFLSGHCSATRSTVCTRGIPAFRMMANCWQVRARLLALIFWNRASGSFTAVLGTSFRERTTSQLWRIWATASLWLTASTTPFTRSPLE